MLQGIALTCWFQRGANHRHRKQRDLSTAQPPEGSITQTYTMHLDYVIDIKVTTRCTWNGRIVASLVCAFVCSVDLLGLYVSSDQPTLLSVWMSRLRSNKCFNRDFKQTHRDCERQRMCRYIHLYASFHCPRYATQGDLKGTESVNTFTGRLRVLVLSTGMQHTYFFRYF